MAENKQATALDLFRAVVATYELITKPGICNNCLFFNRHAFKFLNAGFMRPSYAKIVEEEASIMGVIMIITFWDAWFLRVLIKSNAFNEGKTKQNTS